MADFDQSSPFADQVAVFRDAALVVGVTGAGLTNMLWQPLGGAVLILHMPLMYYGAHARAGWAVGRRVAELTGSLDVVGEGLSRVRDKLLEAALGSEANHAGSQEQADRMREAALADLDGLLPGESGSKALSALQAGWGAVDVPNAILCLNGQVGVGAAGGAQCASHVEVRVDPERVASMAVEMLDSVVPRFRRVLVEGVHAGAGA